MPAQHRDRVFVSYSHKDKEWLEKFSAILAPDIRNGRVDYWDDRELQPGDPWYVKILEGIHTARVAVLLVSPNFLASRFIMEDELPRILAARDDGLTIIWIPLFGTFYGPEAPPQIKPITEVQAAFDAAKPLANQEPSSQTALLLDVCRNIQRRLNPSRIPCKLPFNSLAEFFKGRDEALAKLDRNLRQHGSDAIVQPQAIHAPPGFGKTRLAIEYAWRHQSDFTAFLFVSANTPDDLDRNLAALCHPDCLDLRENQSPNQREQRDAVVRWLQQNKNWLLILDNVDTDEGARAAKTLIAKLRGGHVIITSRVTGWGHGVYSFALDILPLEEAVGLLVKSALTWRAPQPDDKQQARTLANRLGCLPLALTHAMAYMEYHQKGFQAYLDDFDDHFERLLAYHDHLAIEYETELPSDNNQSVTEEGRDARKKFVKTVATTYFLSFDRLAPESKAILQAAAFLAPDPIPVAMFEQCPDEVAALVNLWCEDSGEAKTGRTTADSLAELARYSLISRGEGTFSVHRMEQRILRKRVADDDTPEWNVQTRAVLCKYAPDETAESPRTWAIWDVLRPHAELLVAGIVADERIKPHHDLMSSLGCLYFGKGLYALSLASDEDAMKVIKRTEGAESTVMASKLLAYGESLRELGRTKEALEAFKSTLIIRERIDGKNSKRVADALNYIGLTYSADENDKEAEKSYRQANEIYESLGDKVGKADFAKSLHNLAALVWKAGNLTEAETLFSRAVELTRDDGKTTIKPQLAIICRAYLANLMSVKGDFVSADKLFKDVVDRILIFPEDHPFRESTLEAYSLFLRKAHKLDEARIQFNKMILINRPGWNSENSKNEPERRLRAKLRILETSLQVSTDSKTSGDQLPEEFAQELIAKKSTSWQPLVVKGITIRDTQNLSFDFIFHKGSEELTDQCKQYEYQKLMVLFLSSIAVDEAKQWAATDGTTTEMQSTELGSALLKQAHVLNRIARFSLDPRTPCGKGFWDEASATVSGIPILKLEIWVTPSGGSVYTGEPVGDLARFGKKGEAHAYLLKSALDLFWEWSAPADWQSTMNSSILDVLNRSFETHIAPRIQSALNEGQLLSGLRQINNCMFLATWFKQEYRHHPKVARFLDSGNPNQLSPTIKSISAVSEKPADGSGQVGVTITEAADWGRGIDLNNKALELRKQGRPEEAEPLLREALRFDEELRGSSDPKIPHRLNNLCTVLIMQSKLDDAKPLLARAWQLKSAQHDITSPRLLFVRLTLALLKSQPIAMFLGQLKALLSKESLPDHADVAKTWDIGYFIEHLKPKLGEHNADFLSALADAMNDHSKLATLESFPEWRDQASVSLETPWQEH